MYHFASNCEKTCPQFRAYMQKWKEKVFENGVAQLCKFESRPNGIDFMKNSSVTV